MRIPSAVVWVFIGLLCSACSSTPALHVVGVHEGVLPEPVNPEEEDGASSRRLSLAVSGVASDTGSSRQPAAGPRQDTREVTVNVTETGRPMVLALMAYNRTLWRVSLKPGVRLNKVILAGYHRQQVSGIPAEIPIETYTYEASPCDHCWQGPRHFESYEEPPRELRDVTGLPVTSFQGRYTGSEFFIFPGIKAYRNGRPASCRPADR